MQTQQIDRELVRRLAATRADGGSVLSVYLNLDPHEFATPDARATAIRSIVDEAERRAREDRGIRPDVERVRDYLRNADFQGAHGLAVFSSAPVDLFEAVRLPRAVPNEVVVDSTPFVDPLTDLAAGGDWFVLLVNRRLARFLRGTGEDLTELGRLVSDTHGQHDQGGWSQARYARSIDNEAMHHLRRAAQELERRLQRTRFRHLLLGAPDEAYAAFERELSSAARERLRGRVRVDVEIASPEDVLDAARPLIEEFERERQNELLDRLRQGIGAGGRGAGGLADVLEALSEQRVEALLLDERFAAPGVRCTRCGWLGPAEGRESCPADGAELEQLADVREAAVESALRQDAEVVVLRERPELGPNGGIGAVLRF